MRVNRFGKMVAASAPRKGASRMARLAVLLALCAAWLVPGNSAAARQEVKLGEVQCAEKDKVDPYSFWPKFKYGNVEKEINKKYVGFGEINKFSYWITCRGFKATVYKTDNDDFKYHILAHFSRLNEDRSFAPPLWGFTFLNGTWAYNINLYFDSKLNLKNVNLESLWN